MKSPITIDFVKGTITMNASFAQKASNPFSTEFAQLQTVRTSYPEFTVLTRTIKKNSSKESYKGLTYDYMRAYIMSRKNGEERTSAILEFDELLLISQCHSKGRRYPVIKNWFLDRFPEVKAFGMEEVLAVVALPSAETSTKVSQFSETAKENEEEPKKKTA